MDFLSANVSNINMDDELTRHELYKYLSWLVYYDFRLDDEFEIIDEKHEWGYDAYAIRVNDYIIIVNKGTELELNPINADPIDFINDGQMLINKIPTEYQQALDFFDVLRDKYEDYKFVSTGLSLGGSLTEITAIMRECDEAVAFNPFGVKHQDKVENFIATEGIKTPLNRIINYNINQDVIISGANIEDEVGVIYTLDRANDKNPHLLESFPDLSTRKLEEDIQPQEWKKDLHNLIDPLTESVKNNINISIDSSKELKSMIENFIDKFIDFCQKNLYDKHNRIKTIEKLFKEYTNHAESQSLRINHKSSSYTQCAGTYPVNGYTRSDGTEVSGYMRTCGAKHNRLK